MRVLDQVRVEQALTDQLLSDRRSAAVVAADRVERGRDDADRVDARVRPEGLVLDRGRGVDQDRRDLLVGDRLAVLAAAESGELDRARAVVDDRFARLNWIFSRSVAGWQALAVHREHADDADQAEEGNDRHRGEKSMGSATASRAAPARAAPGSHRSGSLPACRPSRLACICARL